MDIIHYMILWLHKNDKKKMKKPINQKFSSKYTSYAVLGIPITNSELSILVDQCLEIIKKNKPRSQVSYFLLVDWEMIIKCYGFLPTSVDHPELLSILRKASLSCSIGSFLTKLANLLGTSTAPSFPFHEFILTLCYELGENENGIFILGDNEKEAKASALSLHDRFKKLRLVGIAAPPIVTEGEDLIRAHARDILLVEQINSSNAEVLFISLGNPKQLLWLERVREHLLVPLIIATDGTLDLLKKKKDEPIAISQNKNHFLNNLNNKAVQFVQCIKLSLMAVPLVVFHTLNRTLYRWFYAKKNPEDISYSQLFISSNRTIAIITLPECLDETNQLELKQVFDNAANHDVLIFDFHNVRHIQPAGFHLLIKAWLQRQYLNKEIYAYSITSDIEWLMKLQRTWDLFKNTVCESLEILLYRINNLDKISFYDAFTQEENHVTISLLGSLKNDIDYDAYLKKLMPIVDQKNCKIDFAYCNYIESIGISFLLNLQKHQNMQNHWLVLSSVSSHLRKQLQLAGVDHLFTFR